MTFTERAIRAARLDVAAYEDVEGDRTATLQALAIVILANIAAGVGMRFGVAPPLAGRIVAELISWVIWAGIVYAVGVYLLPERHTKSNVGELLRTIGFSQSPGILRFLGVLPFVGALIYHLATLWTLVTMVVAIRQALDYKSTVRAVAVCLIGGIIAYVFRLILL